MTFCVLLAPVHPLMESLLSCPDVYKSSIDLLQRCCKRYRFHLSPVALRWVKKLASGRAVWADSCGVISRIVQQKNASLKTI